MTDLVWLVPAIPLGMSIVNLFLGRRLGRASGWLAALAVAAAFVVSVGVFIDLVALGAEDRVAVVHLFDWIGVGSLEVPAQLRVDPLSLTMILMVTGVSTLIHVYAIGYMEHDPRFSRFFAYLNLFVFFMLTLVLADNYLLMFVGWEGVGLCSYLLIGFWYERPSAANAAKKAFVVTRIGDTAMLIGIALIVVHFGSLDFGTVLGAGEGGHGGGPALSEGTATAIALLLFAGAVGKSAQVPLHTWLPDAMEGPTPVSALIHAATMVTAGVYLVVRSHVLFEASGVALTVVLVVGLVTAVYAGTAALAQDDFKRVLAYSTISQLGYMFFAAGMGSYAGAMFLLVVHAFFKAAMFLAAGSVMHGLHDETDVKRMGALRRVMPVTAAVFAVGWLAISGVPFLSGFFAKDQILAVAFETGRTMAWVVALGGAFLTALYMSRLWFLAFTGESRSEHHGHESPAVMTAPMVVLAILALLGGLLGLSAIDGVLPRFLEPVTGHLEHHGGASLSETALAVISVLVALSGMGLAYYMYGSGRFDWAALRGRFSGAHRFLERGWYLDDAYSGLLVSPGKAVSAWSAFVVDQRVIDGAVNGIGRGLGSLAGVGRRIQTGFVRSYALAYLLGVVAILLFLAVRLG